MYNQQQVRYRRGFGATQCGKCTMFRKGSSGTFGRCSDVTGQITPYGVCDIHEGLSNPFGVMPHQDRINRVHARLTRLASGSD